MENQNEPAFPTEYTEIEQGERVLFYKDGLTKREYFAGLAMQGICASIKELPFGYSTADMAVMLADALLAELAKPQKPLA